MAGLRNQPITFNDDENSAVLLEAWARELRIPTDEATTSPEYFDEETAEIMETERKEFDTARRQLLPTERLRTQGQLLESALLCGHQLRQDLAKLPAMAHQSEPPALRLCIMQLLLVLCDIYPELSKSTTPEGRQTRWLTLPHTEFLDRVVEKILEQEKEGSRLLSLARDLAAYNMLWPLYGEEGASQWRCAHVFKTLLSLLGREDPDTFIALKYMVEGILLHATDAETSHRMFKHTSLTWKWQPISSWQEMERWCQRHGQQLQADFGADHPSYMRYLNGLARVNLAFGSPDTAMAMLREAFDRREKAFGEVHSETLTFIDGLLEAYCQERAGKPRPKLKDSSAEVLDSLLVDELIDLCLSREAYEEVDDLVQECSFPHKATDSVSPNEDFADWSQFELKKGCKIQPRLASSKAPPGSFYWEDSRMYFRRWNQVTLTAACLEGPKTRLPAKIIVTEAEMKTELPVGCGMKGYSSKAVDPYRDLRSSDIWKLLDAKRSARDWNILLAWDWQDRNDECLALAEGPPNHDFFVFEDSLVESGNSEPARSPMSRIYRFKKLPNPGSQWLVMTQEQGQYRWKHQRAGDPVPDQNEPMPGDRSGKYAKHQFWFSVFQRNEKYDKASVGKLGELTYEIADAGSNHVNLVVPFVEYAHFKTSSAYHAGLDYKRFIDVLRWWSVGSLYDDTLIDHAVDICAGMATAEANTPVWLPQGPSLLDLPIRNGFMNGIPGDSAVVHDGSKTPFSLVSSKWKEWKKFTIHQSVQGQAPDLKLQSGESVSCHGFIMGTWTEAGVLDKQWSGLCLYVVDCEFGRPASGDTHHFFLNANMLGDGNLNLLSGWDKKLLCAELNFCLFRYAECRTCIMGSVWKPSRKKKEEPAVENVFWAEMNRREKWDREYEQRLRSNTHNDRRREESSEPPLAVLEREKEAEEKFRLEWDLRHASPQTIQLSTGNA